MSSKDWLVPGEGRTVVTYSFAVPMPDGDTTSISRKVKPSDPDFGVQYWIPMSYADWCLPEVQADFLTLNEVGQWKTVMVPIMDGRYSRLVVRFIPR